VAFGSKIYGHRFTETRLDLTYSLPNLQLRSNVLMQCTTTNRDRTKSDQRSVSRHPPSIHGHGGACPYGKEPTDEHLSGYSEHHSPTPLAQNEGVSARIWRTGTHRRLGHGDSRQRRSAAPRWRPNSGNKLSHFDQQSGPQNAHVQSHDDFGDAQTTADRLLWRWLGNSKQRISPPSLVATTVLGS
jgi:hypothetical protein